MKKSLKETLAPMTTKQKIEHIWEYYRWFIIGGIFIVMLISVGITEAVNRKNIVFNAIYYTNIVNEENLEKLNQELTNAIIPEDAQKDEEIIVTTYQYYPPDENGNTTLPPDLSQKMVVEIASQTLDVLILPEDQFLGMSQDMNAFANIEEITDKVYQLPNQALYTNSYGDITGIKVSELTVFDSIIEDDNLVLCVLNNSVRKENVQKYLEYLIYDNE